MNKGTLWVVFADVYYWSSTEGGSAWFQNFGRRSQYVSTGRTGSDFTVAHGRFLDTSEGRRFTDTSEGSRFQDVSAKDIALSVRAVRAF